MITISGTLSKGWMAKTLGVVFDRDYYFDPYRRHTVDCRCNGYAAEQFPGMRLFFSESNLGQIDYWDRDQIQVGGIQPNMILGVLLGADFVAHDSYDAEMRRFGRFKAIPKIDFGPSRRFSGTFRVVPLSME